MIVEVAKGRIAELRTVADDAAPLGPDRARLRIDAFALTTNNVTYAVFGDAMQYWSFFPTADPQAWGRVPVWGFAEVVESTSPDCTVGERLYGYFPMASELVIEPGRADDRGVADLAAHRQAMAGAYNRYLRCATDPVYDPAREAQQMLLYPLFFTSFVVDDFFVDHDDFGTDAVIVSSASSKTAIGVAFLAHRRGRRVVGLTSSGNRDFVAGLGIYDEVVDYAAAPGPADGTAVFVDIAGNADVVRAVHTAFGDRLAHSMIVGGTHWDHEAAPAADALAGPRPAFFFAPTQIAKRTAEWGREKLDRRNGEAWAAYSAWTDAWLEVRTAMGADAVAAAWTDLVAGEIDPRVGFVGAVPANAAT
jgi:NADPH:quinone reductase-like Zn-dependent oxidoreductase